MDREFDFKDVKIISALKWITSLLIKYNIKFQIAGGMAANIYGSSRPLEDIDIDIPDNKFEIIQSEVKKYIVYGPIRHKDTHWNLLLMTLDYNGQLIDLSGADSTKCWNESDGEWQTIETDFDKAIIRNIYGLNLPIISKENLINYKKIVGREVDLIDIKEMGVK